MALSLTAKPVYTRNASVWVSTPVFLKVDGAIQGSSFQTPAQQQASALGEYLHTRSFIMQVLQGVPTVSSILNNDIKTAEIFADLTKNLKVDSTDQHLVTLTYKGTSKAFGTELLTSIITNYKQVNDGTMKTQSDSANAFYQDQVTKALAAKTTAETTRDTFLNTHPNLRKTLPDGGQQPFSPELICDCNLLFRPLLPQARITMPLKSN